MVVDLTAHQDKDRLMVGRLTNIWRFRFISVFFMGIFARRRYSFIGGPLGPAVSWVTIMVFDYLILLPLMPAVPRRLFFICKLAGTSVIKFILHLWQGTFCLDVVVDTMV